MTTTFTTHPLDATLAAVGSKATQAGAGTAVVGWAVSSEFGILVGIVIGIAGLAVNIYYRHRQDRREQIEDKRKEIEHQRRMAEIELMSHLNDAHQKLNDEHR